MPRDAPDPTAAGRPPRVPVMLLHGIRTGGGMWEPVARLVRQERAVATPDLPGHGSRAGEPFTLARAVDVVAEGIQDLGGRALLAGLSMGGYVAMAVAARHPGAVAGVVAIGSTAVPGGAALGAYRLFGRLMSANPARGNRISERGFRRLLPPETATAVVRSGLDCRVFPQVIEELGAFDVLRAVRAYPGPVWFVNGTLDHFRLHERRFVAAAADPRLMLWPGVNHITVLGQTDRIARTIRDAGAVVDWAPR